MLEKKSENINSDYIVIFKQTFKITTRHKKVKITGIFF